MHFLYTTKRASVGNEFLSQYDSPYKIFQLRTNFDKCTEMIKTHTCFLERFVLQFGSGDNR